MNYLGGSADASFEDIQNDIAYAVSTGSYVIDTMGNDELDGKAYDFDLVNDLSKIDVLVGGEALLKRRSPMTIMVSERRKTDTDLN